MKETTSQHHQTIIGQFSRQAIPFSQLPAHSDSIQMLIDLCDLSAHDHVLDVACGPGLVACEFAKTAKHVTGIDITPKMIDEAQRRQTASGLNNMGWHIGDITALPFEDEAFSVVVTRYTFHHFLDPKAALKEMMRVCKPGGKVLIADVVQQANKVEAYDALEKLRDPSHVHALTFSEMDELIATSNLKNIRTAQYKVEGEVEQQLAASFPNAGDEQKIRDLFIADLKSDRMGIHVHRAGTEIKFAIPILAVVGQKDT